MKTRISRFPARSAAVAIIAAGAVGVAFAQSGSSPSGTPKEQPGSEKRPSGTQQPAAAEAPQVIALNFYADWCDKCQALKPELEQATAASAGEPVLFVTLDQTDRDSRQAEYHVAALGLADVWKDHAGKTGYVLLVDPQTKQSVGTVKSDFDAQAIEEALDQAVLSSPKSENPKSDHPKSDHPKTDHPK
jgi:thiol-disulfide isomerase/thioredoxin